MQEKLIILRKRHGYSQEYVSKLIGISQTQYSLKENGVYEFKADEMFKISKLFNKKMDDIFLPRGNRNGDKVNQI